MKQDFWISVGVVFVLILIYSGIANIIDKNSPVMEDTVYYQGKLYTLLKDREDIFTYNYNGQYFFDSEEISPLEHDKWNLVYFDGDVFVLDEQDDKATKYYLNDDNYEWYFQYDKGEESIRLPLVITEDEKSFLYGMDDIEKEETIIFEDIEVFGEIVKISKDDLIHGVISLAYYKGSWYWKTEVILLDDTRDDEGTPEYVIPLPKELSDKLSTLMNA